MPLVILSCVRFLQNEPYEKEGVRHHPYPLWPLYSHTSGCTSVVQPEQFCLGTDGIRSASGILSDSAIQAEPVPLVCIQRFPGNSARETPVRALSFQADFRLRPVSVSPAGSAGFRSVWPQPEQKSGYRKQNFPRDSQKMTYSLPELLMDPVPDLQIILQTDRKMLRQL